MSLTFWDKRFSGADYRYGEIPNPFVAAQAERIVPGGTVLSVGDGEGRNGVWLAEQGFTVTSQDGSAVAQGKARRMAAERGVAVETVLSDLTAWDWPVATFDAVACIFVHFHAERRRAVHHEMLRALKPGGVLIMEAFHPDHINLPGGPPAPDMLYSAEMLRADFAAAEVLLLEEVRSFVPQDSFQKGEAALTRLIARRPS